MDQVDTLNIDRYWSDTCIGLKFYAVPSGPTRETLRSRSWVKDLVAKHKLGQLRCPLTALIIYI